ncbi:MAG: ribosomal protein S18-alanine N-acetyltransferase [Defluviitaleaceae bacterium]|nr:ribosomal protein S18-alanine N-acetyltransferase [Defluviitaleaceae bacterium]
MIEIIPMALGHLDAVCEIERDTFPIPWTREDFLRELVENDLAVYFVAKDGDTVVGYGGMWHVVNEGHITNIAVAGDSRGRGIGDMLVDALESEARALGMIGLTLEVRVGNEPAMRLYDKHGFKIEGLRKNYYADTKEDAAVMWKYF